MQKSQGPYRQSTTSDGIVRRCYRQPMRRAVSTVNPIGSTPCNQSQKKNIEPLQMDVVTGHANIDMPGNRACTCDVPSVSPGQRTNHTESRQ